MDIPAILISQYQASLEMLKQTITMCPEVRSGMRRATRTDSGRPPTTPSTLRMSIWRDSYETFAPWVKHRDVYDFDASQVFEPYDKGSLSGVPRLPASSRSRRECRG